MQRQKRTGEEGHDDRGTISEIVGKYRTSGRRWPSLSSLFDSRVEEVGGHDLFGIAIFMRDARESSSYVWIYVCLHTSVLMI